MGRHTLSGNPPIEVHLRASARARRLSLRVSRLDGRVTLTLPQRTPTREGIAFLRSKENWLRGHLADLRPNVVADVGAEVLFKGQPVPIVAVARRGVALVEGRLQVPQGRSVGAAVQSFLRHQARDALAMASDHYAARIGRSYTRLSLRDTRSRWGSCTADGRLMYSWRLIMAPPAVLNYVAAHEVAHLAELNHSPDFWRIVAQLCPDYAIHRDWLRTHGDMLHRTLFTD